MKRLRNNIWTILINLCKVGTPDIVAACHIYAYDLAKAFRISKTNHDKQLNDAYKFWEKVKNAVARNVNVLQLSNDDLNEMLDEEKQDESESD